MNRLFLVKAVTIVVACVLVAELSAARKNKNSLYWSPGQNMVDSARFGRIIPNGDVFVASVDSSELKLNGYHVTNAEEDNFYFGELCLPEGRHTLLVYSLNPGESRSVSVERDWRYEGASLRPNYQLPSGPSESLNLVKKGASGSKMLRIEFDIVAGSEYSIIAGKTTADWKVVSTKSGEVVAAKINPVFEE